MLERLLIPLVVKTNSFTSGSATIIHDGIKSKTGTFGTNIERIESFGHDVSLLGSGVDVGGPMLLTRWLERYTPAVANAGRFAGTTFVPQMPVTVTHPNAPSDSQMNANGATAISRTTPTNPTSSLLGFGIEMYLDGGLPSMAGVETWKHRTQTAKGAGSEYLNYEYGWAPLVSDLTKFSRSVNNWNELIQKLQKGSSKVTRVGYHFPSTNTHGSQSGTTSLYCPIDSTISGAALYNLDWYQETKTWFSGAFKYHLPVPDNAARKFQLYADYANYLLGVKLTPAVVWNAAPWSWAADWFTNIGDVMTNVSNLGQNGLVLVYGYQMQSTRTTETITTAKTSFAPVSSYTRIREFKKRVQANPYGFGVAFNGLSNTQKAIVVALGLSMR